MTAEEARHRAAHIHQLEERSPLTGELQSLTLAHTKRLADALSVRDFLASLRHLDELAAQMPGHTIDSPWHDCQQAISDLRAENLFAPGLLAACEEFLAGKEPLYPADICAILGAEETKT
jgi:hypothetical protein